MNRRPHVHRRESIHGPEPSPGCVAPGETCAPDAHVGQLYTELCRCGCRRRRLVLSFAVQEVGMWERT
jgi:hypothetical protein